MKAVSAEIVQVLDRMEEEDRIDREATDIPREDRMFTLHPDTSRLIHIMIQSMGCKNLVEIGVAHGYSTIWLADAARLTGGSITSLEVNPKSVEIAKKNVAEAGVADLIDFRVGDARETILEVPDPIDFVLLDCWETLYIDLLNKIAPKLRPGGVIVADNVDPEKEESQKFIQAVNDHPLMESVSLPVGRLIEVSGRRADS